MGVCAASKLVNNLSMKSFSHVEEKHKGTSEILK